MSVILDSRFQNCSVPHHAHFDNYEGLVRPLNQKLCLFEKVPNHDFGNWAFQCRNNSNIALVCMEEPGAIGHELRRYLLRERGNISGPLLMAILALSVLLNLLCFVIIARLVRSARKKDTSSAFQKLRQGFSNQEPNRNLDIAENRAINKKEVSLDSDANVKMVKI